MFRYALAPDYLERRAHYRDEHLRLAWTAVDGGDLILGGAAGEPVEEALLLFATREGAEAFAAADPYVTNGLATGWRVLPWRTVVGERAADPVHPANAPAGPPLGSN
nr:YciI-like protein [Sphingomonas aerophila]